MANRPTLNGRDVWLALLALLGAWQTAALLAQRAILPAPIVVLPVLARELPRELGLHLCVSAYRVLTSIALAIALAAPLGLLLGQSRRLNRLVAPALYVLYPIPKVVLAPIVLLLLGVGDLAKIALITLILFFQVLVLVRDAAAAIRPELLLSVRSLGAGRRALFRFVYLPAGIPAVLTAVRQSIGTAMAVLYVAESFATNYGLGYYIYLQGSTLIDYPRMYAGVLAMALLGLGLYFGVDALERRLCPET
ncbi:MAG TPA: ABC transporter permease subunit [Anaerolineae bacterium]|nr:ABC transporter permease subunit [Anaerolineae bacterium]